MTEKQRRFCEEFIISGNASQAYLAAGFKKSNNYTRLLSNPEIRALIAEKIQQLSEENVANPNEILGFLSAVMRGDVCDYKAEKKDGEMIYVQRPPLLRERVAAAALLGKRYGLFAERVCLEEPSRIIISEVDIPE